MRIDDINANNGYLSIVDKDDESSNINIYFKSQIYDIEDVITNINNTTKLIIVIAKSDSKGFLNFQI